MLIYLNDMLIVGKTQVVKDAIQVLQQPFEVKKPTTLEDYLGVQVIKSKMVNETGQDNSQLSRIRRRCSQMMCRLNKVHQHQEHQLLLDRKLLKKKIRLWRKNKHFITQEWAHYCISQNNQDQTLPMQ